MKIESRSRRMFLQGAGGTLLALPFLESLLPRQAAAAIGAQPLRFIVMHSYNGQLNADWYPTHAINGYKVRDSSYPEGNFRDGTTILTRTLSESSGRHPAAGGPSYYGTWAPLSEFAATGVSDILDKRLNPYLEKLLLIRGLDFLPDTNHNWGGVLGNFHSGQHADKSKVKEVATIDQVLAWSPKFYPSTPAGTRALHLSPGRPNTISHTHYGKVGGPIERVTAHLDPLTAFQEAFPNPTGGGGSGAPTDPSVGLVDRVYEDYRRVLQDRRLGRQDKENLQRHVDLIAELQGKLRASTTQPSCSPQRPASSVIDRVEDVASIRRTYSLMLDVITAAIRCGQTKIATLDISKAISPGTGANGTDEGFVQRGGGERDPLDWHWSAHQLDISNNYDRLQAINRWIAQELFVPLLQRLDVEESNGKTFLDNSIVFWGNELGVPTHHNWSVPVLLAGSAGGYLQTGRYIDYVDWNMPGGGGWSAGGKPAPIVEGVPYNRLLVTLLQAFGLSPSDYEDGEPGYGSFVTAGKSSAIDYDLTTVGSILPSIRG